MDPIESLRFSRVREIRERRDSMLKGLDVPFMMALETGDEKFKKYIILLKNFLRKLPDSLTIYLLKTPEDLIRYNPFNNILRIGITDTGGGYAEPPTVTIDAPNGPFLGAQAKAVALIRDGKVVRIELVDNGCGYTEVPNVSISAPASGTEAKARCVAIENFI